MNIKLSLFLLLFGLPCAGQEEGDRAALDTPKGESFTGMLRRFHNPIDKINKEPMTGSITALSMNSAGDRLVVGFRDSLMVVLDRKEGKLTSLRLPGVVRSLSLDPTESFITVACDADLYNVDYKNQQLYLLHVVANNVDFFGIKNNLDVEALLVKDVPKLEYPSAIPITKHTCAFECVDKYIVFHRAQGSLIVDPNASSYLELLSLYSPSGGGIATFMDKDKVQVMEVEFGELVSAHDNMDCYATTNKSRNAVAIKDRNGLVLKLLSFPSLVSSLMAIRKKKDCYLIGTETGKVYYYNSRIDLQKEIDMKRGRTDKAFSVLTSNAEGTVAAGSIGADLYFGALPA